MLMDTWIQALEELGARVTVMKSAGGSDAGPDAIVDVVFEGSRRRFVVEMRSRAPYPSELGGLEETRAGIGAGDNPLLFAPYVSGSLGVRLVALGWSWADARGNYDLAASPWRLRNRTSSTPPVRKTSGFPRSSAGLKIVRALIARPRPSGDPITQARLAVAAGVTQPRVSQILAGLAREDLVERTGRMLRCDSQRLWEAFLDNYAGPGGDARYGYTLDPLSDTAVSIMEHAAPDAVAISADVASDLLVPVRRPTHLIVYQRAAGSRHLEALGLVLTDSPEGANVTLVTPADDSVFGPDDVPTFGTIGGRELRLADPTQVAWDLIHLGGRDREAASKEVVRWMLSTTR